MVAGWHAKNVVNGVFYLPDLPGAEEKLPLVASVTRVARGRGFGRCVSYMWLYYCRKLRCVLTCEITRLGRGEGTAEEYSHYDWGEDFGEEHVGGWKVGSVQDKDGI